MATTRQGNDRSVKTIKFLAAYAKLVARFERRIVVNDPEGIEGYPIAVERVEYTPEIGHQIELLGER